MQIPQLPIRDSLPTRDSLDVGVGRTAERLLQDPLHTVPEQFRAWTIALYNDTVRLLPRIVLAVLVAALILALAVLFRNLLRGRRDEEDGTSSSSVGLIGVLIAALTASEILGATVLAAALLTFTFFYGLATIIRVLRGAAMRRWEASPEAVELVITVTRYALITVGTVDALATLGLNLGGVVAGLGILGLAVGLAAQDSLANLIAGFVILWDRPFRVGDWVQMGDNVEGRVRRLTLRTTRLETLDEGILVLPNKEVTSSRIYNYSLRHLTRVRVPVDINYDADVDAARAALLSLVPSDEIISRKPEPFVAVTALGESAVRVELVFYITQPRDMYRLRWQLYEATLKEFRVRDIEITYPHMNLHLRSGVPTPG